MSQSAARNADRQESHNAMAVAVTEPRARCSQRPALNVARVPKFLSSLEMTDRFIAAIATEKYVLVDNLRT